MTAVLQFRDYHVIESHYKFNPFPPEELLEDNNISPKIFYNLETNPNSIDEAAVFLGIEIGDPNFQATTFYVKVRIVGLFVMHERPEDMSEEDVIGFYKINAVAILFPYLRAIVSDISSKGSEGPIILPTMNIVNMIAKNEFKEMPTEFNEFS